MTESAEHAHDYQPFHIYFKGSKPTDPPTVIGGTYIVMKCRGCGHSRDICFSVGRYKIEERD